MPLLQRRCSDATDRLRRAIVDGELVVHLQPEIELSSNRVVGFEALVRWQDPERGLVPPDAFVPLAEHSGLIGALERFVFVEACRHHAILQALSPSPVWISINLSASQLARPGIAPELVRTLEATGTDPDLVWLEVTETMALDHPGRSADILHELQTFGVHLALDDFGTGWSSLLRLKGLPVEMIKIDRTFVGGLGAERIDTEVVTSLTQLAQALDLLVVAEGVEHCTQRALLADLHCDYAQGYLWAPALDIHEATTWLTARS